MTTTKQAGMLVVGLGLKANFVGFGLGLERLGLGINYKAKIMETVA